MKCPDFVFHPAPFLLRYISEVCGFDSMTERDEMQEVIRLFDDAHNHIVSSMFKISVPHLELLDISKILILCTLADGKHTVEEYGVRAVRCFLNGQVGSLD